MLNAEAANGVKTTPAMASGLTDHVWTVKDIIALTNLGARLKDWVRNILKQSRVNLKWFYLPPDENIGFAEKMGVDFRSTITVGRSDLERRKFLRRGRLNPEADEHFRERLSEYYRRYPVDEWYPFNREELEEYRRETDPNAEPRNWQRPPGPTGPSGS